MHMILPYYTCNGHSVRGERLGCVSGPWRRRADHHLPQPLVHAVQVVHNVRGEMRGGRRRAGKMVGFAVEVVSVSRVAFLPAHRRHRAPARVNQEKLHPLPPVLHHEFLLLVAAADTQPSNERIIRGGRQSSWSLVLLRCGIGGGNLETEVRTFCARST